MSANMFPYAAGGSYFGYHMWAINKQQMYAGAPTVQVVDFAGDTSDFTVIPANARLQAGSPPAGSPEYFVSTEQFLNAVSVYKFHVDWDKVSTSTFTGPDTRGGADVLAERTPRERVDAGQLRRHARDQSHGAGPVLEPRRRRVALGRPHRQPRRVHDRELRRREHATTRPCAGTRRT